MPYKDPEARRAYHVINSERAKERARQWRQANPDKARAREARRATGDPERASRHAREWRATNAERAQAYDRARVYDPEKGREQRLRREQRLGARRDGDTQEYVAALIRDPCAYCDAAATGVDHIVPLKSDGTDRWDNLTACCQRCNSSKNASALLLWMTRR